jgi:excisionase family DNA binding protein
MSYTLGQAAKATGKSKTTIQRAIAKGRISATKDVSGAYQIDPSELHRVFTLISPETVPQPPQSNTTRPHDDTPVMQVKIDALEEMLAREREALDEMRTDRDAWKQQATALLSAPPQKRRRWWQWK